jgi:glycerol-3-phosphate dehydrogenase
MPDAEVLMPPRVSRRDERHDVAVIGAGVVGCAIARAFALAGLGVALIERGRDILSGASKANSAILHTGFDAVPGSLEAACVRDGHALYRALHAAFGLPLLETGALLVAWTPAELAQLPEIVARARANGVEDARIVAVPDIYRFEPGLAGGALGAVVVPGEAVIDPWSAPLAYALQAVAHGALVLRGVEVTGGQPDAHGWRLATTAGTLRARVVVNCAGLYGDLVEAIARPSPFAIRPRKGQFVVLDKTARRHIRGIVLPVPNERTKGVLVSPTAFGNVIVGPTAEDQEDRRDTSVDGATLEVLHAQGARLVPALADEPVTAAYAGLRPATQVKDFVVEALPERRWITVSGIRSTGLTASLGLADHVASLHAAHFGPLPPRPEPIPVRVPNLAEESPRPWQTPGRGEIVCHCEMVTRAELEAALDGPLPAGDLGGLKRRTRCMLGRCQGFHCTRRVLEIATPRIGGPAALAADPEARR